MFPNEDRFWDIVSIRCTRQSESHSLALTLAAQLFSWSNSCAYSERDGQSRHMGGSRTPRVDRRELLCRARCIAPAERRGAGLPGLHVWPTRVLPLHVDRDLTPQSR